MVTGDTLCECEDDDAEPCANCLREARQAWTQRTYVVDGEYWCVQREPLEVNQDETGG